MRRWLPRTLAGKFLVLQLAVVALVLIVAAVVSARQSQAQFRTSAADRILGGAENLAANPTVRFKLDAAVAWSDGVCSELAAMDAVDTVDFKGRYGLEVEGDFAPVYEAVVQLLPDALIEDPHVEFADALPHERVSFDAPIKRVADIGDTRTINIKPTRIGGLRPLPQ